MNMSLKIILYLAISLLAVFAGTAQNIHVTRKITAPNGTEIADVHIFDSIAEIGTTSDKDGIFTLYIPKKATKLRFSHVAFETKYFSLTGKRLSDTIFTNTIWINVVLTQKIKELPVAEISDAKVEIAYKNSKQWILDYEPVGADEFLLLLLEKNKKYLQLINSNHKKISQILINKDYNALFKDSFGNFHLLSKDSACQIFLIDEKLMLLYQTTRHNFDQMIEPIVVNTDHQLYKKEILPQYKTISYYKIDKKCKSKEFLYTINNQIVEGFQEEKMELYKDLISAGGAEDMSLNVSASSVSAQPKSRNVRTIIRAIIFNEHLLSQEPCVPLFQINDELCLFNHIDDELIKFSLSGEKTCKININYHTDDDWDKEIIVNEEKTRCFAKFTRNGGTSLVEINPHNGQTMGR